MPNPSPAAEPTELELRWRPLRRLVVWIAVALWALASWWLGDPLAAPFRFRVNDFSAIPGAGVIERDVDGVLYHVNAQGGARPIYPVLGPENQRSTCLGCTVVSGEQLSQVSDFCASSTRRELPRLRFEIPCKTWAPADQVRSVAASVVFFAPFLLLWIARTVLRSGGRGTRRRG